MRGRSDKSTMWVPPPRRGAAGEGDGTGASRRRRGPVLRCPRGRSRRARARARTARACNTLVHQNTHTCARPSQICDQFWPSDPEAQRQNGTIIFEQGAEAPQGEPHAAMIWEHAAARNALVVALEHRRASGEPGHLLGAGTPACLHRLWAHVWWCSRAAGCSCPAFQPILGAEMRLHIPHGAPLPTHQDITATHSPLTPSQRAPPCRRSSCAG
jgi:hypothetical protein